MQHLNKVHSSLLRSLNAPKTHFFSLIYFKTIHKSTCFCWAAEKVCVSVRILLIRIGKRVPISVFILIQFQCNKFFFSLSAHKKFKTDDLNLNLLQKKILPFPFATLGTPEILAFHPMFFPIWETPILFFPPFF